MNGATTATAYDFDSIMHYSRAAFSANGQDTITCQPAYAAFQTRIGNRTWMSPGDAQGLQARYGQSNVYPTITGGCVYVRARLYDTPWEADLAQLFELAERAGIVWLKFDMHGATVEGIESFEDPGEAP